MPVIDEAELAALAQMDLARSLCEPIQPDRWEGSGAKTVGIVTARKQADEVAPILEQAGIVIEFRGSKLIGATGLSTEWGWRHKAWRSPSETVQVLLETRDRSASGASKAAVTTAKKIYVEQLLGLRVAEDAETELCHAHDSSREAARVSAQRLLKAYCRKTSCAESRVLVTLLGLHSGHEWTFEQLMPVQVWILGGKLTALLGTEHSIKDNPGASPRLADDLPPALGGEAANDA